jgi:hypothetical protein
MPAMSDAPEAPQERGKNAGCLIGAVVGVVVLVLLLAVCAGMALLGINIHTFAP